MINISTFFTYFNPFNQGFKQAATDFQELNRWQKTVAVAAGIFAGLASIFALGLGSFAAFRKVVEVLKKGDDPVADRTDSASQRVFDSDTSDSISSSGDLPDLSFTEETPREQLQRISLSIIENKDILWSRANENLDQFLTLIREEFRKEGRSFSETLSNKEILRVLCSSGRVQAAVKLYDLRILSQTVHEKREEFTAKAQQIAGDDPVKTLYILTLLIRGFYQTHGHSLSEVFHDPVSKALFMHSGRLTLVLDIYCKLKIGQQEEESPEADEARRERRQQEAAKDQAREHAGGVGLVTQLGLEGAADDQEQLKRQVRQFLIRNHPDKNSHANMDDVRAANAILQMMKDQQFELYRAEIERLRRK